MITIKATPNLVEFFLSEGKVLSINQYQKFSHFQELAAFLGVHAKCKEEALAVGKAAEKTKVSPNAEKVHDGWSIAELEMNEPFCVKTYNKALTREFGCSPSKFLKMVNGLVHKTFVTDKFEDKYVREFCMTPLRSGTEFKISVLRLKRLESSHDKILQADRDGIYNIAPFIFYLNKTPAELKQLFGSGNWKLVSKFSKTRNKLLAKLLFDSENSLSSKFEYIGKQGFRKIIESPSTLLHYNFRLYTDEMLTALELYTYLAKNFEGQWSNKRAIYNEANRFIDTDRLLVQLGRRVNGSWSPRRVLEEHDAAVKEINKNKYSDKPFAWITELGIPLKFEYIGYNAEVLLSAREIADEGLAMHHCVGGYSAYVEQGKYIVVSIKTKDGERYSTLGINWNDKTKTACIEQHYKAYNARVDDEVAHLFAKSIIAEINKVAWTKINETLTTLFLETA